MAVAERRLGDVRGDGGWNSSRSRPLPPGRLSVSRSPFGHGRLEHHHDDLAGSREWSRWLLIGSDDEPTGRWVGSGIRCANYTVVSPCRCARVPQPSEPATPAVPEAPVAPAVPDPELPAHPESPQTSQRLRNPQHRSRPRNCNTQPGAQSQPGRSAHPRRRHVGHFSIGAGGTPFDRRTPATLVAL
jgi:hypothetical protein